MKRLLALLLAMCMSFSIVLAVACDGENHTHNWGEWSPNGDGATHTRECLDDSTHTETADCEGADVCSVCGGEIISTPNPNPNPGPVDGLDVNKEIPDKIDKGTYNSSGSGKTEIKVLNMGGGIGWVWLEQAAERWAYLMQEKSYANGKKGVYINISNDFGISTKVAQAQTSDTHVFFSERKNTPDTWGASGVVMNLDEIVKDTSRVGGTLESKIYDSAKSAMIGTVDGEEHYYAIPHYEFYGGSSYNREIFNEYGAYFADTEKCNPEYIYTYESRFGERNFIVPDYLDEDDCVKAPGPDGIYDTEDDGLPVSFEDYVALCEYFKVGCEIAPIVLSGAYVNYICYYVAGLWSSLAGQEQMSNYYDFNGKMEVVTGYTNEPIMEGIDYIKKPTTEWVDVTAYNGYYGNLMASKYYAHAMVEILVKEGYFAETELGVNTSHLVAQKTLIYGGKATRADNSKAAMLVEASYWYNESKDNLCFKDYVTLTGDTHEVDLRQMALPTAYTTAQWEERLTQAEYDALPEADKLGKEVHRASALIDIGQAYCMVNNNIKDNPELRPAVVDFVKFLYSENELRYFTMTTGMPRSITYDLSEAQQDSMGNFYKRLWNLRDWESGSNMVYVSPGANPDPTTKATFIKAKLAISIELATPVLNYDGEHSCFYKLKDTALNADGVTYAKGTRYCFEVSSISEHAWGAYAGQLRP